MMRVPSPREVMRVIESTAMIMPKDIKKTPKREALISFPTSLVKSPKVILAALNNPVSYEEGL